ncbi:hypothetical protein [Streptomyces liliifuscus]|uniref:Uncharacterized protein n=1 Tax=Streptomyces liliifuscus TaxID=2797636 RepID=A0A7T7L2J5_9ACTN|nr:hypothetical protein [Streptomyces liliifuscus]QQM45161.1 hypothetical protein JEQ17_41020 [Streptomyces liliifuscus]
MTGDESWILHQLDARAAAEFLAAVAGLVEAYPHPLGASLRLTVQLANGDIAGSVAVDPTNLADLGFHAARRAAGPVESGPPPRLAPVRHLRPVP